PDPEQRGPLHPLHPAVEPHRAARRRGTRGVERGRAATLGAARRAPQRRGHAPLPRGSARSRAALDRAPAAGLIAFRRVRQVRLQDTLTGERRTLEPRDPPRVGIYACGPTVYGPVHVGNARPFVVFALLKRFLEHEGYEVTLVVNITDVNDKVYDAARAAGLPSAELAAQMADAYRADTDALELGRPDHEPLASETIAAII